MSDGEPPSIDAAEAPGPPTIQHRPLPAPSPQAAKLKLGLNSCAGTHPIALWHQQRLTEKERCLLGTPLPELREKVLAELRGTAGCTHLNDALRALARIGHRDGRKQRFSVGMPRRAEQGRSRRQLDDSADIHDGDTMAHVLDD